MKKVRLVGRDSLHSFVIVRDKCDICTKHRRRQLVVNYDRAPAELLCNCGSFFGQAAHLHEENCAYRNLMNVKVYRMLTWVDLLKHTILGNAYEKGGRGYMGVQCGCLAKFHRQVAHIADSIEHREMVSRAS